MTTAASEKTQQFLSFFLPPHTNAMLPTQQLTEILSLATHQIVPIPDVPPQVMGVCNWRGEVLWLLDLGYLLGAEPISSQNYHQSSHSAIVVHAQDCMLGLVVGQINRMLWCNPAHIQPIPMAQNTASTSPCLRGYWLSSQAETLLVLDSQALIDSFRDSGTSTASPSFALVPH
jgi:positive phototaxis protein PixI